MAIYDGNEPSAMRLIYSLVLGADEVDFLITGASAARSVRYSASGSSWRGLLSCWW